MTDDMPQGKKTVSDDEIVKRMREHKDPFLGAGEVAGMFDHTRQWAHSRLKGLNNQDRVRKKTAGKRSVIWWPEED